MDCANSHIAYAQAGAQRGISVVAWPGLDKRATIPAALGAGAPLWSHLAFSRDGTRLLATTALPEPLAVLWERESPDTPFVQSMAEPLRVQHTEHACSFFPGSRETCCFVGARHVGRLQVACDAGSASPHAQATAACCC